METTDERLEEVRRKAAQGICYQCDEEVAVFDGPHVTGRGGVPAIQDAVTHENRHPGNSEREGDIEYIVEDGYYPDEWSHYVDLSEVPEEHRNSASIGIISELAKRNLVVNSMRFDPPQLHVIGLDAMAYGYYGGDDGE
jgi:hypothetical protein